MLLAFSLDSFALSEADCALDLAFIAHVLELIVLPPPASASNAPSGESPDMAHAFAFVSDVLALVSDALAFISDALAFILLVLAAFSLAPAFSALDFAAFSLVPAFSALDFAAFSLALAFSALDFAAFSLALAFFAISDAVSSAVKIRSFSCSVVSLLLISIVIVRPRVSFNSCTISVSLSPIDSMIGSGYFSPRSCRWSSGVSR